MRDAATVIPRKTLRVGTEKTSSRRRQVVQIRMCRLGTDARARSCLPDKEFTRQRPTIIVNFLSVFCAASGYWSVLYGIWTLDPTGGSALNFLSGLELSAALLIKHDKA